LLQIVVLLLKVYILTRMYTTEKYWYLTWCKIQRLRSMIWKETSVSFFYEWIFNLYK
jgi:hypothetical protein